jgi:hypothetical protein
LAGADAVHVRGGELGSTQGRASIVRPTPATVDEQGERAELLDAAGRAGYGVVIRLELGQQPGCQRTRLAAGTPCRR